jgi:hypothetical protein
VNRAVRNALVWCEGVSSGNGQVDAETNWATDQDPGFVDAAGGDFRLRPDSAVYARLPDFAPLPLEQVGPYADELRPDAPREPWRCA